jgi:hypothetical protein
MCADPECHAEHAEIMEELREHTHPQVDRIIDLLEGPKVRHLDGAAGPDRVYREGMKYQLGQVRSEQAKIRRDIANGYHIRPKDMAKIVGAVSAAVVSVLGAVAALF